MLDLTNLLQELEGMTLRQPCTDRMCDNMQKFAHPSAAICLRVAGDCLQSHVANINEYAPPMQRLKGATKEWQQVENYGKIGLRKSSVKEIFLQKAY
jgi:hypothetical protein